MKQTIIMFLVSLTTYGSTSSAQQATTWTNPYFYYHYNTPLALPDQKISANKMVGNQKLDETHSSVKMVKNELTNVITSIENLKTDTDAANAPSSIGRMPKSCDDLQQIGHTKSGFFTVMGKKTIDNVYCDFTKPIKDDGFQKMIGYVDVKTSPVYFYAQKTFPSGTINAVVPFDLLRLNVGNAMNTSGIFIAPKPGKYFFSYSGISFTVVARVELQVKNATANWLGIGHAFGAATSQTFSLQANLELAEGDQIRLRLVEGVIADDASHYTNFVGHLLEEDIIQ